MKRKSLESNSSLEDSEKLKKENQSPEDTKEPKIFDDDKIQQLEQVYRDAIKAFKANKDDKDLRRARSATKKAWDDAVIANAPDHAEPLKCKGCSQLFLFLHRAEYTAKGWKEAPSRCEACLNRRKQQDRTKKDNRNGKQMCYAFQKGCCQRGDACKFSHDIQFKGRINMAPICQDWLQGTCKRGHNCKYRHKERETNAKTGT